MRKVVLIPTYWSREEKEAWREGDAVYDHPTPIDGQGTLGRTLESMKILTNKDFKLVLLVCPTAPEIAEAAEKRVTEIVREVGLKAETYLFTIPGLQRISDILKEGGASQDAMQLLSMSGYANVRNMCLLCAEILDEDVAILIDDDEVFEKKDFISRAVEFIGKRIYGDTVYGMAGYYLNKNDQYYDDVRTEPWMTYWDRFESKARAFDEFIGCAPRIKRTPFAFGGNMVIHRNLLQCVPFDPCVTRGEDIDYVINSRMYGFSFFIDNTLSIKHLPVEKKHPQWKRIREDIYRFVYEKSKLSSQYKTGNMVIVSPEDFDPYPGAFLRDDLEEKIYRSNMMLSMDYIRAGDMEASREALNNIAIAKKDAVPQFDTFSRYRSSQKAWEQLIAIISKQRYSLRKIMEEKNLSIKPIVRKEGNVRQLSEKEIRGSFKKAFDIDISETDWELLKSLLFVRTYYEGETVFSSGDYNDALYILLKGEITLLSGTPEGVELTRLRKGDVLGESCLIHQTFTLNGRAEQFTEMLCIKRDDILKIIDIEPTMGVKLYQQILMKVVTKLRNSNIRQASMNDAAIKDSFIEE